MKFSDWVGLALLFAGVYSFNFITDCEVRSLRKRVSAAEEHINDLAVIIAENVDEKAAQSHSEEKE